MIQFTILPRYFPQSMKDERRSKQFNNLVALFQHFFQHKKGIPKMRRVMVFICLLVFLFLNTAESTQAQGVTNDPEPVVVTAITNDHDILQEAVDTRDVWHVATIDGEYVATIYATHDDIEWLEENGFIVDVDEARTAKAASDRRQISTSRQAEGFFGGYRTVDEINAFLHETNTAFPPIVDLLNIGNSLEGRPIWAVRITNESETTPNKPKFLAHFGIHARELAPPELGMRLIEHLTGRYGWDADVTALVDNTEIWVIVLANPDGRLKAQEGLLWRKNTRPFNCGVEGWWRHDGVDLNRNSSTSNWGTVGTDRDRCKQQYPGLVAASEPETQAFEGLVRSLFAYVGGDVFTQPAPEGTQGFFVTVHSYGNDISWPWGLGTVTADGVALRAIGEKITQLNGYTAAFPYDYPTSGSSDDRVYEYSRVPAILYEVGSEFFEPYGNVQAIWEANLPTFLYGIHLAGDPYSWYAGPEIVGTGLVSGTLVNPRTTFSAFADFPGASTVHYFIDSLHLEVGRAPQGTAVTISGAAIPNGRHTIIAQGCREDGVCGAFHGIGFIEAQPVIWVDVPAQLATLNGPDQVVFRGGAANYDPITRIEVQYCTQGGNVVDPTCEDWTPAWWNGTNWQATWDVPAADEDDDGINVLLLKVRLNGGMAETAAMYGVNTRLGILFLPLIHR